MNCEVCGMDKGKRVISGIHMCEGCFSKIAALRQGDTSAYSFFSDRNNLLNTSKAAREYINAFLNQHNLLKEQARLEQEALEKVVQIEQAKKEYARNIVGLYEYDVVTILNKGHGRINREEMLQILSSHARDGWKLHTIYSNELGKNAITLLGIAVNETACEDVLIFERKLEK